MGEIILDVKGLKKHFPINKGKQKGLFVKAIDGIDFDIREGETLGLVGESGSGKSTTAYNVIGMYNATAGQMTYKGTDISMANKDRELWLKRDIQMVFQDPGTTLNPQRTVAQILSLPLARSSTFWTWLVCPPNISTSIRCPSAAANARCSQLPERSARILP